ncbi:hypothetical protein EDD18DRAFT_1105298 [Armillaria luteobubalina]|uniref:WW domain-containing protein n=1 Tax=Armillaria luteobubalina TaxID=153913 RepID=A0AA39Q7F9_9AGAR|nr:hypothetical protein EDD18DRAFT_1105298 [Armillaria luteobubalina]
MQAISSLAAPSHEIQDTGDEHHVSSFLVVVERDKSTVIPQTGTSESIHDWSNVEKEFEETLPSSIGHYKRKTLVGEEEVLPMGWVKHTHLDGKPYFYHEHDKIIPEGWLYDRDVAEKVLRYISMLQDTISKRAKLFGPLKSWHLYVEITEHEQLSYYFVNHDAECIFWLSKCTLDGYLRELLEEMSPDMIRSKTQLFFFSVDATMSDTSTVTMSIDNLKIMSKTIILAESKTSHFINSVAINRALTSELDASEVAGKPALCMVTLLRDQIYNYHGQRHGYDFHKEKRTVLFRIANLLLFHAPIKHYKIWVDRITFRSQQDAVVEQIICELNLSNGMATALLAVNMAFLAIPSVDEMGAHQQPTVTKVLICFSVVASMGSIVVGLFLIGHHTALKHANTDAVARLNIGPCLERLAIAYSVPHALLMWG